MARFHAIPCKVDLSSEAVLPETFHVLSLVPRALGLQLSGDFSDFPPPTFERFFLVGPASIGSGIRAIHG
jgi:hypothetical protein